MFCIFCGTHLPSVARFCRACGRRVDDETADERQPAPQDVPASADDSPRAPSLGGAVYGRLTEWPERFAGEMAALLPGLSPQDRLAIELACRSHVNSIIGKSGEIDLDRLAARLTAAGGAGAGRGTGFDPD